MADDTARIRADIEQTRAELGATVQALAEEMDPRTRARRAVDRVTATVRENPLPAAAVAAGVLMLLLARRQR